MSRGLPNTKNESHVKRDVKKLLDKYGWFWWMTPANGFGRSGISDFCAIKSGMFLAVETKANGGKVTAMQQGYLESVRSCDHFAFVVRETSIKAFETFLKHLDLSIEITAKGETPGAEIGGPMLDAIKVLSVNQ